MNRIQSVETRNLRNAEGGCGECQTSCGVANQPCESTGRIRTVSTRSLRSAEGGCGECQTSCQSACKTSCGVANQPCERN